jgi:DNA-binding transcriptional ArsR family regulator
MGLLPSSPDVSGDASPRVVGLDSEEADALVSALTSETARDILSALHDEPASPKELADRVDTSLQNAQYHLGRLEDAGAIEVAGTAYSEKGREMDVFAPADSPLVIVAGREEESTGIQKALRRLVGGVGVLALGSLVVQQTLGGGVLSVAQSGGADGGDPAVSVSDEAATGSADGGPSTPAAEGATGTPTSTADGPGVLDAGTPTPAPEGAEAATSTATPSPVPTAAATPEPALTETATAATSGSEPLLASLPPGVVFFLGGLSVLVVVLALTLEW